VAGRTISALLPRPAAGVEQLMANALELHDLRVTYRAAGTVPVQAVAGVSLEVPAGSAQALIGESGCGKSTLGRAVANLVAVESGSILVDGVEVQRLRGSALRRHRGAVQMIFQDPHSALNPRRTVLWSVTEPLRVSGANRASARTQARDALERVGIPAALGERYPHQLSGGQKQRINIARALICNPKIVVCDEPVAALDVSLQAEIINLLVDLQQADGITLLFITHDVSLLPHLADGLAVMYLGELVETGPARDLVEQPAHPYTIGLLAAAPRLDRDRGEPVVTIVGELPDPASPPAGCRFHPRCPFATQQCLTTHPELRPFGHGLRRVACHHAERIAEAVADEPGRAAAPHPTAAHPVTPPTTTAVSVVSELSAGPGAGDPGHRSPGAPVRTAQQGGTNQ
jgi:peptide/nickel transport system ATP-binding protein